MLFHLCRTDFEKFIQNISIRANIDIDIIEKDYYVYLILKELAQKQDYLKAYFKGGTAIYKILNTMNRFSEDIDLTVKVLPEESNTKNRKRLKESALGYKIPGISLIKNACLDRKGSVTGVYKYTSIYKNNEIPLQRANSIQVEATSFTISEPTEKYFIEPLIYKLANIKEKTTLEKEFDISGIEIETLTLERMFVDKLFATEFYYLRNMFTDTSKHLYDLSVLFKTAKIQKLLKNKNQLYNLIRFKRKEEELRIGGINKNTKIKDFNYFKLYFEPSLLKEFQNMQNKYVLTEKYKIKIEETKNILNKMYNIFSNFKKENY